MSVPKESCPDPSEGQTINWHEAIERSRSHLTLAIVPYSERDDYFLKLTHALQKKIEEEVISHGSIYLPIAVYDRAQYDRNKLLRCIIAAESGRAYRLDWSALLKASHNDLLESKMVEIYLDDKWYNFVSDTDGHFNMLGNFKALNQAARVLMERRNRGVAEAISTAELINRSKLLTPIGANLGFAAGGGAAAQPLWGFHPEEVDGRWTNGDGEVVFAVDDKQFGDSAKVEMRLKIDGYAILPTAQSRSALEIIVGGNRVDEVSITQENKDQLICVGFELEQGQKLLSVRLRSKQRFRPVDLGLTNDVRQLGFMVRSLQVSPAGSGGPCDEYDLRGAVTAR